MKLLANYSDVNGSNLYYQIPVAEVTDETSAKSLVKAVRSVVKTMRFPSRQYNAKGVLNWVRPEDIYLLVTPETNAVLDVDVLAKAFNMDKTTFMGNVVEVPGFGTGMEGTQALLVDKAFFQIYDTYRDILSTGINARHLTQNYYYHHQGVMAVSPFYNAIQFTTGEFVEPTTVTITGDASVSADGETHTYTAVVSGGENTKVQSQAVVWEVENNPQYVSINQNGNLVVSPKFSGASVKIKATSVLKDTVYAEKTITIA